MVNINHLSTPFEYAKLASIEYGGQSLISSGLNGRFEKICERSESFSCLNGCRFNTWKVALYRNIEKNEYIVVFRGTHPTSVGNWLQDFLYFLRWDKNVKKWMNKKMDEFTRLIGANINTFVGHSAGGYLATVIKKDWEVYRVTFNGLKCKKKDLNLNLRLRGDFVSKRPLSNRHNYKRVGDGNQSGHKLKAFLRTFEKNEIDWNNIYPSRFDERSWFSNMDNDTSESDDESDDESNDESNDESKNKSNNKSDDKSNNKSNENSNNNETEENATRAATTIAFETIKTEAKKKGKEAAKEIAKKFFKTAAKGAVLGACGNVVVKVAKDLYKGKTIQQSLKEPKTIKEAKEGAFVGAALGVAHVGMVTFFCWTATTATVVCGTAYCSYHVAKFVFED